MLPAELSGVTTPCLITVGVPYWVQYASSHERTARSPNSLQYAICGFPLSKSTAESTHAARIEILVVVGLSLSQQTTTMGSTYRDELQSHLVQRITTSAPAPPAPCSANTGA